MESDIIDLENRSDTPTRRLNSAKKNDQTDEAGKPKVREMSK